MAPMKMEEAKQRELCRGMACHIYQFNDDAVGDLKSDESIEDLEYLRGQIELFGDTMLYTTGAEGLEDLNAVKLAIYPALEKADSDKAFADACEAAFFGE